MALNLRTSLIVDPPDGKLPPLSAEGQTESRRACSGEKEQGWPTRCRAERAARRALHPDGSQRAADARRSLQQQLPDHADAGIRDDSRRDAPRRPHHSARRPSAAAANVRQWTGSSRGRWEGQTLVVETTNLTDKFAFQGSSENMRLTERFTRVDEDTMRYQFTVDDPVDVDATLVRRGALEEDDRSDIRARLSRRELRLVQHARGRSGRGEASRRRSREKDIEVRRTLR